MVPIQHHLNKAPQLITSRRLPAPPCANCTGALHAPANDSVRHAALTNELYDCPGQWISLFNY